jgi:hypothetical protein
MPGPFRARPTENAGGVALQKVQKSEETRSSRVDSSLELRLYPVREDQWLQQRRGWSRHFRNQWLVVQVHVGVGWRVVLRGTRTSRFLLRLNVNMDVARPRPRGRAGSRKARCPRPAPALT